jgi:hypothetical protein
MKGVNGRKNIKKKFQRKNSATMKRKISFGKRNEAKNFKRNKAKQSETKRNKAKKLVLCFRLSMRKQSETDPVSLRFASKRKKIYVKPAHHSPKDDSLSNVRNRLRNI